MGTIGAYDAIDAMGATGGALGVMVAIRVGIRDNEIIRAVGAIGAKGAIVGAMVAFEAILIVLANLFSNFHRFINHFISLIPSRLKILSTQYTCFIF